MKNPILHALVLSLLFPLNSRALSMDQINGKWIAKQYLSYGIESGKVSQLPKMVIKPEHFGSFMYAQDQELKIELSSLKKTISAMQKGRIRTTQPLLDSGCALLDTYKNTIGCSNKSLIDVEANFRLFTIDTKSTDADEKALIECWKKNSIEDVNQGFSMSFADSSAHIGFVGRRHLLLRSMYYEKPLKNPADALKFGCPTDNRCWIVFMRFDRDK